MRWWAVETTTAGGEPVDGGAGTPTGRRASGVPGRAGGFDDAVLWAALESSVRAPSIHNSQPWRWRIRPYGVELYADPARRLPHTDPDGRDQVISCGAVLHHLLVALAAAGQGAQVLRVPDPSCPDHLATVEPAAHVDLDLDPGLAAVIDRRCTDRRPFRPWPVPPEVTGELAEIADRQGVGLTLITDPRARRRLFRAIGTAGATQDADPAYGAELAAWSGRPAGAEDGVPADRAPAAVPTRGQMPMRGFAGAAAPGRPSGEPESAALLLLFSSADTPLQWLRVGEVTSAILLTAARHGLAASALTQPLEVAGTRGLVADRVLGARTAHPHMLFRMGWPQEGAPAPRPTPRRPVAEVVEVDR
jgi:nitroreductase